MPAYIVVTREKTRDQSQIEQYKKLAPESFKNHSVVFHARGGRQECLEGPAFEQVLILEFPTYEAAKAWYNSDEYQSASKHRFQGGDYRIILTEGIAP